MSTRIRRSRGDDRMADWLLDRRVAGIRRLSFRWTLSQRPRLSQRSRRDPVRRHLAPEAEIALRLLYIAPDLLP